MKQTISSYLLSLIYILWYVTRLYVKTVALKNNVPDGLKDWGIL